jgi:hypothetical protein
MKEVDFEKIKKTLKKGINEMDFLRKYDRLKGNLNTQDINSSLQAHHVREHVFID